MKAAYAKWLALALALAAALALLASGPGTRFGAWNYRVGFDLLRWGVYVGGAAAVISLIGVAVPRLRAGNLSVFLLALIVGLVCVALPLQFRSRGASVPRINDVSTDLANPAAAEDQKKGYPDIRPLELPVPPAQAFSRALSAAEAMRWEIVKKDAAAGRFEAVDTTFWFGFKDDIAVRVTPSGTGSRIDVRSRSRVGRSDLGTNARRIRAYMERLK